MKIPIDKRRKLKKVAKDERDHRKRNEKRKEEGGAGRGEASRRRDATGGDGLRFPRHNTLVY